MSQPLRRPRARSLVPVLAVCAASLLGMRALPAPAAPVSLRPASVLRGDTVPPVVANVDDVTRALQEQYPPLLRDAGIQGSAQVQVRVTADGVLAETRVVQASHPEFGQAAVRALAVARFRPARSGGSPVGYTFVLPLRFQSQGGEWPAIAAEVLEPRQAAWDQPPVPLNAQEIVGALNAEYPPLLRDAGITARAQVQVHVAATGQVLGVQALSSTHPEAGPAAERVLARARFRPARKAGQPVEARVVLPVEFRVNAVGEP